MGLRVWVGRLKLRVCREGLSIRSSCGIQYGMDLKNAGVSLGLRV